MSYRLLAISLIASCFADCTFGQFESPSYPPGGNVYVADVTRRLLRRSPHWPEGAQYPPVSAREALSLAEIELREMVPASRHWKPTSLELSLLPQEETRWIWQVAYYWDNTPSVGTFLPEYDFLVYVLMDGNVVEPKLSDTRQPWPIPKLREKTETSEAAFRNIVIPSSPPNAKPFDTIITKQMVAKSPSWRDADCQPPISPRRALSEANELIDSLVEPQVGLKRQMSAITLVALHGKKWYWRVEYDWYPTHGGSTGVLPHCYSVILMDGTVVEPQFRKDAEHGSNKK